MPKASRSTIRRAADLLIGENLMGLRAVTGSGSPLVRLVYASSCPDHRSRLQKKTTSNSTQSCVLHTNEEKRVHTSRGRHITDYALAAMEQMELYCQAHPGSPSAVRRPDYLFAASFGSHCSAQASKKGSLALGPPLQPLCAHSTHSIWPGLRPPAKTERPSINAKRVLCGCLISSRKMK